MKLTLTEGVSKNSEAINWKTKTCVGIIEDAVCLKKKIHISTYIIHIHRKHKDLKGDSNNQFSGGQCD